MAQDKRSNSNPMMTLGLYLLICKIGNYNAKVVISDWGIVYFLGASIEVCKPALYFPILVVGL
jgi:hypothetical protein